MYTKKLKENLQNRWFKNDNTLISSRVAHDIALREEINSECYIGNTIAEKVYCVMNDITSIPTCLVCTNKVKFRRYKLGYADYCSVKCRANDPTWQKKVANTNLNKYGVTHIAQLPHEREKRKESLAKNRPHFDMRFASNRYRKTILERYGENYNAGWTQQAIETRIRNGTMCNPENIPEFIKYKNKVSVLTKHQPLDKLDNIEKRGNLGYNEDAYHIDHIYSVYDGFLNDVDPSIIASFPNLQCIPARENISKRHRSAITLNELFNRYEKWVKENMIS
tara:strand:+ start:1509 stop:2345 length:837 start_codon:yes stop_codon:yes gene_type:complete